MRNPQYYSDKNSTNILNIKSGHKYYFIGDCGHEFLSLPCNAFRTGRLNCPYCCGRRVLKGFNDIWTTNPDVASKLKNSSDGYKYTICSNKQIEWECPDCGSIILKSPLKMSKNLSFCQKCSKLNSYGEKFITEFLNQLCEIYEKEKIFDWSDNKRYDFYLPEKNCIIEVHGKQHYSNSDFSYLGGKHYYEEIANDEYKKDIALLNNISNYIIIDARQSDVDWIKKSICNSELPILLNFNYKEIMWDKCNEYAVGNETKFVCQKYNELGDIHLVANYFHCSYNTVKSKLKQGTINGWCNYDAENAKRKAVLENGKRVIKTMSKPVVQYDIDGNFVKEYLSIQQAQRETGHSHIWDCINGKRKTAGGYQWKYMNDCNKVKPVVYEKSGKPCKSVNQYDINMILIKTWGNITEAAKALNLYNSNIINVCNNRQKTSGGFIWRYNDDSKKQ